MTSILGNTVMHKPTLQLLESHVSWAAIHVN